MAVMYAPQNNSPKTQLTDDINSSAGTMTVSDASVLPDTPNVLTLGTGEDAELVLATNITGNIVSITRGFNGTTAKAWPKDTYTYRAITAQDISALQANIVAIQAIDGTIAGDGAGTFSVSDADNTFTAITESSYRETIKDSDIFPIAGTSLKKVLWTTIKALFAPMTHASRHETGGDDALTPSAIGAAAATHASTHATGGDDAISPASIGAAPLMIPIETITGNTTIAASHLGKHLICTNSSAITITIPSGLSVGFNFTVERWGTGTVTITGQNRNGSTDAIDLGDQYDSSVSVIHVVSGYWSIKGGLA